MHFAKSFEEQLQEDTPTATGTGGGGRDDTRGREQDLHRDSSKGGSSSSQGSLEERADVLGGGWEVDSSTSPGFSAPETGRKHLTARERRAAPPVERKAVAMGQFDMGMGESWEEPSPPPRSAGSSKGGIPGSKAKGASPRQPPTRARASRQSMKAKWAKAEAEKQRLSPPERAAVRTYSFTEQFDNPFEEAPSLSTSPGQTPRRLSKQGALAMLKKSRSSFSEIAISGLM
jgi:hypothetical protein